MIARWSRHLRHGLWLFLALALSGGVGLPAGEAAAQATPVAPTRPNEANAGFRDLLALAPAEGDGDEGPPPVLATYANIAAQLAALDLVPPSDPDDPRVGEWIRATQWLAFPSVATKGLDEEWRTLFGFDLLQVDETLEVGQPPATISYLRGRFDHDALVAAWTAVGYRPVPVAGAEVYSLHEEYELDMESPVTRLALANMNNAAILPDGTLVFTSTLERLRLVLAVARGEQPSLAERVDVGALLDAATTPLASAMLVPGVMLASVGDPAALLLEGTPDIDAVATAAAARVAEAERMPPISLALLGVTPGGPLPPPLTDSGTPPPPPPGQAAARFLVALLFPSPDAARQAAPVIEERLATQRSVATRRPFAELFASWDATALPGQPITLVDLTFGQANPRVWSSLLFQRDLSFLAW